MADSGLVPVAIERIVSGGQTGVDRAALDVARELRIPHGGWCPAGRRAEDGRIADEYELRETPTRNYAERTAWNARDSDGTLILAAGKLTGGTRFTKTCADRLHRPCLVCDPHRQHDLPRAARWLAEEHGIRILNIAGPRASSDPALYEVARAFLLELLAPGH